MLRYNLQLGKTYRFQFHAASILETAFTSAELVGAIDYEGASQLIDVRGIHAAMLPSLPEGTPTDPTKLHFLVVRTSTGQRTAVAEDWLLNEPTFVSATGLVVTIPPQPAAIRSNVLQALKSIGIVGASVEDS